MAGVAVLVYDGDCGFCTASARWVRTHAYDVEIVPWQQADLPALGLTVDQCTAAVQYVEPQATIAGGAAVAAVLRRCRQPYRLAGIVLGVRVLTPIREWSYAQVAANRHRLPGSSCAVSDRDERPLGSALGQGAGQPVPPAHR